MLLSWGLALWLMFVWLCRQRTKYMRPLVRFYALPVFAQVVLISTRPPLVSTHTHYEHVLESLKWSQWVNWRQEVKCQCHTVYMSLTPCSLLWHVALHWDWQSKCLGRHWKTHLPFSFLYPIDPGTWNQPITTRSLFHCFLNIVRALFLCAINQ